MNKFELSEEQAQAILNMRLRRLTGLEREKLEEEYKELIEQINRFNEILSNERLVYEIIRDELLEIKERFGDSRRTRIMPSADEIDIEDMIEEEDVIITLTHHGYIKRMPQDTYKTQRRGGKGITGLTTRKEDFVKDLFITSTHDIILFFTNKGRAYSLKAYEIPEGRRQARGTAIINLLNLTGDETITTVIPIEQYDPNSNLIFLTQNGIIKKTKLDSFKHIRKNGIIAMNLKDDDQLIEVRKTNGEREVIIVTAMGMAIRFSEENVRAMGRNAMGVIALKLRGDDKVVAMDLVEDNKDLLVVSEYGFGKRTPLKEYRLQNRGGIGLKTYNPKEKTGKLISAKVIDNKDDIIMISMSGIVIRLLGEDISTMGRNTQGVTLMRIDSGEDKVMAVAKYIEEE